MRKAKGNILPLAIMMTMITLMAGISLGVVVVDVGRRSVESDHAVFSYYMADAGIEKQLYDVRKKNVPLSIFASTTQAYPNGGSWFSTTGLDNISSKKFPLIKLNEFSTIDLFDPDNAATPSQVCKLDVTWSDGPLGCPVGTHSLLEASYGYWTVTPIPQWPSDNQFVVLTKSVQGNLSQVPLPVPFQPLSISGLLPDRAYRIRLRAFNCDAQNVQIQAYGRDPISGLCNVTNFAFPGDLTLSVQGNYGGASQKIVVTMPKQDVLSGVFSYVVFSECTIVKGAGTVTCPP